MPKQQIESLIQTGVQHATGSADAAKEHFEAYLEKEGTPQLDVVQSGRSLDDVLGGRSELTHARKIWFELLVPQLRRHEIDRADARRAFKARAVPGMIIGVIAGLVTFQILGVFSLVLGGGVFSLFTFKEMARLSEIGAQSKKLILASACELMGFKFHDHHEASGADQNKTSFIGKLEYMLGNSPITSRTFGMLSHLKKNDKTCPTPAMDAIEPYKFFGDYDRQSYDDMITGERAGARFSVVEAHLQELRGSGKSRHLVTCFRGLLMHIEYPEKFLGTTVIARRGQGRKLKRKTGLQAVDIVANEFSQDFDVVSNDQVEARALLTPDRLLRLIAMERHFKGGDIQAVFEDGHLTLAMRCRDLFEVGDVKSGLVDESRFAICLDELGVICDVIDGYMTREWAVGRV